MFVPLPFTTRRKLTGTTVVFKLMNLLADFWPFPRLWLGHSKPRTSKTQFLYPSAHTNLSHGYCFFFTDTQLNPHCSLNNMGVSFYHNLPRKKSYNFLAKTESKNLYALHRLFLYFHSPRSCSLRTRVSFAPIWSMALTLLFISNENENNFKLLLFTL